MSAPAPESPLPPEPRLSLAGLPAYSLFAFLLAGQLTLAAFMQLASIPVGLILSEVFLFAAPALLCARAANFKPASFLGLGAPPSLLAVLLGLLAGAANFVVAGGLQILVRSFVPEELARSYDTAHLFRGTGGAELAVLVVALGLFAPLCEEIAFRGWLQRVLRARHGDRAALLIASGLFALLHLEPIGMAARVELGLLFGLLALWTRSLWPAIAAHAANNLIAAGLLVRALSLGEAASRGQPAAPLKTFLLSLGGLLATALVLFAVRRLSMRLPPEPFPESADPAADHFPRAARLGAWLPVWIVGGLACAAALFALRHTAFQVAVADSTSPLSSLERRLPGDEARERLKDRLDQEKRRAQSGQTDLAAYRALREKLAKLGGQDAGTLSWEQVEAALGNAPDGGTP